MPAILILRLEGALQSWGLRSRWSSRDSGLFPSKSGIIGLIACAMGLRRNDEAISAMQNAVQMAVRADRPGKLLWDYQTITRYGSNLNAAAGKPRTMAGTDRKPHHLMMMGDRPNRPANAIQDTIISQRQYLQDASFTVFLAGPKDLLSDCVRALDAPRWQIYLGRKSCPPSTPVLLELTDRYGTLLDAARDYPLRNGAAFPVLCEMGTPQGKTMRQDLVIKSGTEYAFRRLDTVNLKGDD